METEKLQFDETIEKFSFLFRYRGFNLPNGEKDTLKLLKVRCIYYINLSWILCDLFGAMYWFADGLRTGKDFLELTYIAPCISVTSMANINSIFFVVHEKNVQKLIKKMRALERKEKATDTFPERENIINEEKRFLNLIIRISMIINVAVVLAFALSPLFIMLYFYLKTDKLEFILPFLILYPFNPFTAKVWPFVYMHQVWSEVIISLDLLAVEFLFFTCCTYVKIHFRILQHKFETLIPDMNYGTLCKEDKEFRRKFNMLVVWHQELIEVADLLEVIYTKSFLANFMSSSITICLAGFNVSVLRDASVLLFLSFLFWGLAQIFFLCYFADLVRSSSQEISDAVYKCKFYCAEPKIGKSLLIIQERAQEPCKLTALGFAEVNLNSFMRILSTAWSYFALLQTIYGTAQTE